MTDALRKLCLITAGLLIGSVSSVYGADLYDDEEDDFSISADYEDVTPAMDDADLAPKRVERMPPPDEQECCEEVNECCYNLFARVDFLYWRACEDGLEDGFGSTVVDVSTANAVTTILTTEKDKEPDFEWKPGVRVGVGYEAISAGWDLAAYWTFYKGRAHQHQGSWNVRYNVVDLIMTYPVKSYCHPCFTFIPLWGVRGSWIKQHLSSTVVSTLQAGSINGQVSSSKKDKQHFWGVGPEVGFEATYDLGCGWGVYGGIAGALMYGNSDFKATDTTALVLSRNTCENTRDHCVCQYAFDGELGFRWTRHFCDETRHLTLQAGWEQHTLFDFNQIGDGDLNLYGLVISASFQW